VCFILEKKLGWRLQLKVSRRLAENEEIELCRWMNFKCLRCVGKYNKITRISLCIYNFSIIFYLDSI
jgi:hypothetical protein